MRVFSEYIISLWVRNVVSAFCPLCGKPSKSNKFCCIVVNLSIHPSICEWLNISKKSVDFEGNSSLFWLKYNCWMIYLHHDTPYASDSIRCTRMRHHLHGQRERRGESLMWDCIDTVIFHSKNDYECNNFLLSFTFYRVNVTRIDGICNAFLFVWNAGVEKIARIMTVKRLKCFILNYDWR